MKATKNIALITLFVGTLFSGFTSFAQCPPAIIETQNVNCFGGNDGTVNINVNDWTCTSGSGTTTCGTPDAAPQDYCATCTNSTSPGNQWVNTEICLQDGYNGDLNLNTGAKVIVCGTATINNINFNGGTIIVLGTLNFNNSLNANNPVSEIYNYGTITANGITFPGLLENHGTLTLQNTLNIQSSSNTVINTGTITVNNNDLNVDAGLENRGTINVFNGKLQVNSNANVVNKCTIDFNTGKWNTMIVDGTLINQGSIIRGRKTTVNSNGHIKMGIGSVLETERLSALDGLITRLDLGGCASLQISNEIQGNGSNRITGDFHLCGITLASVNNQSLIGAGVVESCTSCELPAVDVTWNDGFIGTSRTDLSAGTYHVTASCDAGCSLDQDIVITEPTEISMTVTPTTPSQAGLQDGTATASATGGTGTITFTWSNNTTGNTTSGLGAGTHTVTATDANGCTKTQTFTVDAGPLGTCDLPVGLEFNPNICVGGSGIIQIIDESTGNGNSGNNQFQCITEPVQPDQDYCASCTTTETGSNWINVNPGQNICIGTGFSGGINQNGGKVVVCGTNVNIQSWNLNSGEVVFMNNVTLNNFNLNSSNPQVTVKNYANVTINGSQGFTGKLYNYGNYNVTGHLNVNSNGTLENYGTITVGQSSMIDHVFNNYGTYTVNGAQFHVNGNAFVMNYCTITVGDQNTTTGTVIIDKNFINHGSLTVGNTLRINSSAVISLETGSVISTKTVERLDALVQGPSTGCAKFEIETLLANGTGGLEGHISLCGVNIADITAFTIGSTVTDNCQSCTQNSQNSTSFLSNYTVDYGTLAQYLDPNDSTKLTGIPAGVYIITISSETCEEEFTIEFTQGTEVLTAQLNLADITAPTSCEGIASIHITQGTAPYSYTWYQGGQEIESGSSSNIAGLCSGSYAVLVEDASNCSHTFDFIMGDGEEPTECLSDIEIETVKSLAESCTPGNDGFLEVNATGGTGGYNYQWSNGATTASVNNLNGGDELVITVTDNRDLCSTTDTLTVRDGYSELNVGISVDPSGPSNTGVIKVQEKAGHTYNWTAGCNPEDQNTTTFVEGNTQSSLGVGIYTVGVTAENGCTMTYTVNVGFDNSCNSENIGVATQGETEPGAGGAIALDFSQCAYTNYQNNSGVVETQAKVEDCDRFVEGTVNDVNINNETVCVQLGTNLDVTNAVNINSGGQFITFDQTTINTLNINDGTAILAGSGVDQVTTVNGNAQGTLEIAKVVSIGTLNAPGTTTVNGELCAETINLDNGDDFINNGQTTTQNLTTTGATIEDNGMLTSTTSTNITNSTINANGKTTLTSVDPATATATISNTNIDVNGNICLDDVTVNTVTTTGIGTVTVSSETDGGPITSTDTHTDFVTNDDLTTVTITVVSTTGTPVTITTVSPPKTAEELITSLDGDSTTCECPQLNGLCLEWSDNSTANPECFSRENLPAGEYYVTIKDCDDDNVTTSVIGPIIVSPFEPISVKIIADEHLCNNQATVDLKLEVTGGADGYDIIWSGPGITPSNRDFQGTLFDLPLGKYAVKVIDRQYPSQMDTDETIEFTAFGEITLTTISTATCEETNHDPAGSISATATSPGAGENFTYRWTTPTNEVLIGQHHQQLTAGTYTLAVSDPNGCEKTGTVTVGEEDCGNCPTNLQITATAVKSTSSANTTDGQAIVTVIGATNYSVSPNLNALGAGVQTITVTLLDENNSPTGCTKTTTVVIPAGEDPEEKECTLEVNTTSFEETCYGASQDGQIDLVISGTNNYQVVWNRFSEDPNTTVTSRNNLTTGSYQGSVTDLDIEDGTCVVNFREQVELNPDFAPINIRSEEGYTLCPQETLELTANRTVRWFDAQDNLLSTSATYVALDTGRYYTLHELTDCDAFNEKVEIPITESSICGDEKDAGLLCQPVFGGPEVTVPFNNCDTLSQALVLSESQRKYRKYLEDQRKTFREGYINTCLGAKDQLNMYYSEKEYQYTLYYYDQAGNLIKTVPPKGVKPLEKTVVNQILDKEEGYQEVITEHFLETRYIYNSLNQLVAQNVPDHRTMNISSVSPFTLPEAYNNLTVTSVEFDNNGNGYMTLLNPDPSHITGDTSAFLVSNDFGETWETASALGTQDLNAVAFGTANKAYAVGNHGTFALSLDAGASWEVFPVGTAQDLIAVAEKTNGDITVLSTQGQEWVLDAQHNWTRTTINTQPWTLTEATYNGTTWSASATQDNKGALLTLNAGTWNIISQEEIGDVEAFTSFENTWYIGSTNGKLYRSANMGIEWERVSTAQTGTFTELYQYSTTQLVAIIDGELKYSQDAGQTWTNTLISGQNITALVGMKINPVNNQAIFYSATEFFYSRDGGFSTYSAQQISEYNPETLDLHLVNNEIKGVVTSSTSSSAPGKLFYYKPGSNDQVDITATLTTTFTQVPVVTSVVLNNSGKLTVSFDGESNSYWTQLPDQVTNSTQLTWTVTNGLILDNIAKTRNGEIYSLATSGLRKSTDQTETFSTPEAINSIPTSQEEFHIYDADKAVVLSGKELFRIQTVIPAQAGTRAFIQKNYESSSLPLLAIASSTVIPAQAGIYGAGTDGSLVKISGGKLSTIDVPVTQDLTSLEVDGVNAVVTTTSGNLLVLNTSTETVTTELAVTTNQLNDYLNTGTDAYYVGNNGFIQQNVTPSQDGVSSNLNKIAENNGTVLIVGDAGKIVRKEATATDFVCVTDIAPLELYSTEMVTNTKGYGVGAHGTIVKTNDGAQTWDNLNSQTTADLFDANFVNVSTGIVIGEAGTLLKTTDGGTTFATVTSGTTNNLNDIDRAEELLITVGDQGTILASEDIFATITTINSGTTDNLTDVFVVNSKLAYIVGENGRFFRIDRTNTTSPFNIEERPIFIDGENTRRQDNLFEVHFVDRFTGYAAGANGALYKTIDGGDNWTDKKDDEVTTDIKELYFTDRDEFYYGGSNGSFGKIIDEGDLFSTKFWYDELGRLVVSQHSRQNNEGAYSYTRYDEIGRIKEVGEVMNARRDVRDFVRPDFRAQIPEAQLIAWLTENPERRDVVQTIYDNENLNIPGFTQDQENLRNRVASVYYYEDAYNLENGTPNYTHASHYTYDVHGNVDQMVQDIPDLAVHSKQYFIMDYEYDLISGNVHEVGYQRGEIDQFIHRYYYDADNRIDSVQTSRDGVVFDNDATYDYYRHGPLARTEIGQHQVQGMDYAYTIHGWLKGVNSESLNSSRDIGKDGIGQGSALFAQDEYGFALHYYEGDYKSVSQTTASANRDFLMNVDATSDLAQERKNLFNGNISSMVTGIREFMKEGTAGPNAMNYTYDQLNRLKTATNYQTTGTLASNNWTGNTITNDYNVALTYDQNGNILNLDRTGTSEKHTDANGDDSFENRMDELSYVYETDSTGSGSVRVTNRLLYVRDAVNANNYGEDIDGHTVDGTQGLDINGNRIYNYAYDEIGNLTQDLQDGIVDIQWNVQNKVKRVIKNNGADLAFDYSADGNRLMKEVRFKTEGSTVSDEIVKRTYYIRDASGNVMANYEVKVKDENEVQAGLYKEEFRLNEHNIYGSSMLGLYDHQEEGLPVSNVTYTGTEETDGQVTVVNIESQGSFFSTDTEITEELKVHVVGRRFYQGANHLGNVLVVFTDRKIANGSGTTVASFSADVVSASDYYPFGMLLPNRNVSSDDYRYGFNGKERDPEGLGGGGATIDYGFRIYNPQLGKFLSVDPLSPSYPYYSPYHFAGNSPIYAADRDGLEELPNPVINDALKKGTTIVKKAVVSYVKKKVTDATPHAIEKTGELAKEKVKQESIEKMDQTTSLALKTYAIAHFTHVGSLTEAEKQEIFKTNQEQTKAIILYEFASGTGEDVRTFDYNTHPIVNDIVSGYVIDDVETAIQKKALEMTKREYLAGKEYTGSIPFSPTKNPDTWLESTEKHVLSNKSQFFMGGAVFVITPIKEGELANDYVNVTITNVSSRYSLMLHSAQNYGAGSDVPLESKTQKYTFAINISEIDFVPEPIKILNTTYDNGGASVATETTSIQITVQEITPIE